MTTERTCTGCHRLQSLTDFYVDRREKLGVRSVCKACIRAAKVYAGPRPLVDLKAYFEARIQRTDGCWIWRGPMDKKTGYGKAYVNKQRFVAHRLSYELERGEIPEGLVVDHLCRNRGCVRPDHLEPVTNRDNILRGVSFSATNATVIRCPQGHLYVGENLRIKGRARMCRTCVKAQSKAKSDRRSIARAERRKAKAA